MPKIYSGLQIDFLDSYTVYEKIANAPTGKKDDIFRYEMMLPFKKKWDCYNIPIKSPQENGYDVHCRQLKRGLRALA